MTNVDGAPEKPMDNERVKGEQVAGASSSMTYRGSSSNASG